MSKTKLWFAGTPDFAAFSLHTLLQHDDYEITGVLTQPDRPAGRGRQLSQSAVKQLALQYDIPIEQPQKLRQEQPPFAELARPDLIIVAAYGLLLPTWFLHYPRLGCLNIHASLLPRWRGAAPIQRAIAAGDKESGVSIMQMDEGLDTGDVWLRKQCEITAQMTAGELHDQLMRLGAQALLETLPMVLAQTTQPQPQNNAQANYAHKLTKQEARIDWTESAALIARHIRAYNPYPVAHTKLDGSTWRIFQASPCEHDKAHEHPSGTVLAHDEQGITVATGDGALCLIEVQLAGKQRTNASRLRHGHAIVGKRFCV